MIGCIRNSVLLSHGCILFCIYAPGAKAQQEIISTHSLGGVEVNGPPPDQDGRYRVETILKAHNKGWSTLESLGQMRRLR